MFCSRAHILYFIFIIWLGLIILYWDTTHYLVNLWLESRTYGYGNFIFPISIYLIWRKRIELSQFPPVPNLSGLFFLGLTSLAFSFAYLADVQSAKAVCLAAMLTFSVWGLLGNRIAKLIAFPLSYLILAIPLWEPFELVLQNLTVNVVVGWLRLLEIPTFKDGNFISIPAGLFEVEELCAGLRYFLATLAITSLYAYLNLQTLWKQISFVLISLCLSVLTNWIRVFVVILVGHKSNMQNSLVHDHDTFGWILFSGVLGIILLLGWIFQKYESGNTVANNSVELSHLVVKHGESRTFFIVAITVTMSLCLLKLGTDWLKSVIPSQSSNIVLATPDQLGPWVKIKPFQADWHPIYTGADLELLETYQENFNQVSVYIAYYQQQRQDKEMINSLNSVVGENYSIKRGDATNYIDINVYPNWSAYETKILSHRGRNRVVWHWYYVGGLFTINPIIAKLLYIGDLLTSRQGSVVIAIATDYEYMPDNARTVLTNFSKYFTPTHVQRYINR